MESKLRKFFEDRGFEVVEKKTATQILFQNLLSFSIQEGENGRFDVSFNLIKENEEKEKLINKSEGFEVEFTPTPVLLDVSLDEFKAFCKQTSVIE